MIAEIEELELSYLEYIETDLLPNSSFTRYLKTYQLSDLETESEPTENISCTTLANEPLPVIIGEVTDDSVQIILDEADGNPPETEYSLFEENSGLYVQADGSLGPDPVWQTRSQQSSRGAGPGLKHPR